MITEHASIQERFEQFHEMNPIVYSTLVKMARDLRSRGHVKLGIGMLWEVTRWRMMMRVIDPASEYKLNDHYRSRYARLIMAQEPDLSDVFEVRELRS